MNLITNAAEAIGDRSGTISINTSVMDCNREYLDATYLDERLDEGYYVSLEVSDTGCGMDAETVKRIFDPFFTTKFTGRGLGLAAVLGIVRGHRGAVKVYSEPGRGTTFKILLPALAAGAAAAHRDTRVRSQWTAPAGAVLVVDDEEAVRNIGSRALGRVGFTVHLAADGREALDIFREKQDEILCVVLDMTMPHMDGEETFRELRRIRQDVRVILSSGYTEQDITNRFMGKGLAGFIQKPYRPGELVELIRQALETGRRNDREPDAPVMS
jgi:CheY-like chemotaxis protein